MVDFRFSWGILRFRNSVGRRNSFPWIQYDRHTERHLKRGVETKLILADTANPRDETLFKNIAKAHLYFDLIRAGKTYAEIAASEGVSKHRVYKLVDLAFLAPDVLRDVFAGSQPTGLTTEWLLRHTIPGLWDEQRKTFRTL